MAKVDIFYLATAIVGAICAFVCIVILIQAILKKSVNENIDKKIVYLTYGSVAAFGLSMLVFAVSNTMYMSYSRRNCICAITTTVAYLLLYTMSQILIYWLLIIRIYQTFHGTKYALSNHIKIPFSLLLIIFCMCGIAGTITDLYGYSCTQDIIDLKQFFVFSSMYSFGTEVIDFIITVFLVILFIKKLLIVTTDINDNESHLFVNNEISILNNQQKMLLNIITKFFVLTLFATLATQIDILLITIVTIIDINDDSEETSLIINRMYWILRPIDCVINGICLHLMLETNDNDYRKICRGCDAYMRLCCKRIAKKSVKKKKYL
eukprot:24689_1